MKEKMFRAFRALAGSAEDTLEAASKANARLRALDAPGQPEEADAIAAFERDFLSRFAYHSTAIEGSTLTPMETELVLEGEFIPRDDRTLHDMFAARGTAEGYDWAMRALAEGRSLDETFIKDVHERTALDCQPRTRGAYRVTPVYIRNSRAVPVDASEVRDCMAALVWQAERSEQHPILLAAAFHAMFENIHPFQDGNGRTGRIILAAMLVRAGYPPVAVKADDRVAYLSGLEAWQVDGNPEPFTTLVAQSVEKEANARIAAIEETRRCMASLKREGHAPKRS